MGNEDTKWENLGKGILTMPLSSRQDKPLTDFFISAAFLQRCHNMTRATRLLVRGHIKSRVGQSLSQSLCHAVRLETAVAARKKGVPEGETRAGLVPALQLPSCHCIQK